MLRVELVVRVFTSVMDQRNPDTERLYLSRDEIAEYQLQRLRDTLERARRTPFYGPRLADANVQSLDDLTALPLTSKQQLRDASPDGLLAVAEEELCQYHESFGTTGTPVSSWLTRGDLENYAAQINQTAVNFRPGDRVLVRFPYAISVPAHIFTQAARHRGACVIPASSRTNVTPHTRVIELLKKLRATVIGCLPTEAVWLAETARLLGHDPARDFPHLRAICTAGELLSDARRARIAAAWNCQVFNMYGCTEAGNIAADCEAGRLHLAWDHFLLECLDERSRRPVPAGGLGTTVLTTLTRQAMPLLRFELGDFVRLHIDHGCPCGRQSPVVEHLGRDLNQFEVAGGRFFVREIEERIFQAPAPAIGDLWLIEVTESEARFRAEAASPDVELNRKLESDIHEQLGLPLRIDTVGPGTLLNRQRLTEVNPANKPRLVGHVDHEEAGTLTLDDLMPG